MRVILAAILVMAAAHASPPQQAHASPPEKEPIGKWRYKDDNRPVKVLTLGGSIGAWGKGNFSQFLGAVCHKAEIKNRSKTGYGPYHLKKRFKNQLIKNRRVDLKDDRFEYWLIYSGGLNSIGSPRLTIKHTEAIFALAKKRNIKVVSLSLTPWGDEKDRRFKHFGGLDYHNKTREVTAWSVSNGDIGLDLLDTRLRDKDAELRDRAGLERRYDRSRALKKQYPDRESAITAAMAVPRWYLKHELQSFDHIHPNTEGHRIIAIETCGELPVSWACDCSKLEGLPVEKGQMVLTRDSK